MSKSRLSLAVLLCLVAFAVQAQDKKAKPTPTPAAKLPIEVDDVVSFNTELVQTDVMVFDKQGKFVNGLQREQFELTIDGKPLPVEFFDSVVTGGRREAASLKAATGSKPATVDNATAPEAAERGRTVLFFINDLHLDAGSLARAYKAVTNFIERQMGPDDQVAITSASGQIGFLQQLTNNPAVLRAALDRLKFVPGTARDGETPFISDYAAFQIVERRDEQLFDYYTRQTMGAQNVPEALARNIVERRTNFIVRQSDITIKTALSSLVNLMAVTAKLPGRKLVFFISDGFVPNFVGSDFTTVMRRATDAANRSGVVIYTLDARGLSTDSYLDASHSGGADPTGVSMSRSSGERTFTQEPLHALAADTGGRAMLNSNGFDEFLAKSLDETSRYYLLAWKPENDTQRKSNFSNIKIAIAGRPELKVQLRRGYLGPPPDRSKPKTQPAQVQVESTDVLGTTETSHEDLRTSVSLGYKQTTGVNMQLTSSVQLSAQGDGKIDTGVLGAVFDSRGKAVGSFRQRLEVPRSRAIPSYAYVNHQIDLPPGIYQVRVIAYERGTTRLNGAMEWIEIPKLKPGTFSISSLYVGEITEAAGSGQVGVNASGRFARNSRLRFTTYIYSAAHTAGPPQLTAQIKVLRGDQAVLTPPEIKISTEKQTNLDNITYAGEFPLSSLPPGKYVLQVAVTDKTATATSTQQFRFTIY